MDLLIGRLPDNLVSEANDLGNSVHTKGLIGKLPLLFLTSLKNFSCSPSMETDG